MASEHERVKLQKHRESREAALHRCEVVADTVVINGTPTALICGNPAKMLIRKGQYICQEHWDQIQPRGNG